MSKLACHGDSFGKGAVVGMDKHNRRLNKEYGNVDIDLSKTADNILFYEPSVSMYQDAKNMIDGRVRANNGRVRSDSNWISEFITFAPKEENWTSERELEYFQTVHDYFVSKVGQENLLCSVVHKDENTPHMHFSFCPITPDNRLSSKDVMTRKLFIQVHNELPKILQEKGFDIQPGDKVKPEDRSKKGRSVKRYKADVEREKIEVEKELEQVQCEVITLESKIYALHNEIDSLTETKCELEDSTQFLQETQNDLEKLVGELSGECFLLESNYRNLSEAYEDVSNKYDSLLEDYNSHLKIIDISKKHVNDLSDIYNNLKEFVMRSGRIQVAQMFGVDFSKDHNIGEISKHINQVLEQERSRVSRYKELLEKAHPHLVYTRDDIERKALSIPTEKELKGKSKSKDSYEL